MNITKTLSLAFAMIGGALVLTPSSTEAASNAKSGQHISYDALKKGGIPCSKRGASAKNCRVGEPANPYKRGCNKITRCRG